MTGLRVAIIGGGQAGLAMAHALISRGLRGGQDFIVLDAADRTGASWSNRWDSLRLFTPARYSALPGMPFPGPPDAYPGKDDVAAYLTAYAARFDLPVQHHTGVHHVELLDPGARNTTRTGFALTTDRGPFHAEAVVVATGPFQLPAVPALAERLAPHVQQLHSAEYRNPTQIPAGHILVVGAGNSGVQIAADLASTHQVTLAMGTRLPTLPQRLAGRDIFDWLTRSRFMDLTIDSRLGRRLAARGDVLVGTRPRDLGAIGVRVSGRAVTAGDHEVTLDGGHRLEPDAVIWATGYRPDHTWLPTPALRPDGLPCHRRGLTPVPGLAVLGLPWLHTRGSALLGWVGHDAAWIADRLLTPNSTPLHPPHTPAAPRPSPSR